MKKRWKIIIAIALVLILVRLFLPTIVLNYVNKSLSNMDGYSGTVEDIDIRLIRGAYKIDNLSIDKTDGDIPVPFVKIKQIDLSVHWKAIFNGAVVGEIILIDPELNFAVTETEEEQTTQTGEDNDWTIIIKDLMPLTINRFEIVNGRISYKDYSTEPKVDIYLDSLQLIALNLSNTVDRNEELPSSIKASALSLGSGNLTLDIKSNILKKIPDMDIELSLENLNMVALNDFVKAYSNTDIEKGEFNLFTELSLKDGKIEGYLKPVMENLKILDWDEEEGSFLQKSWEAIVGGIKDIFKNQKKDRFATKIPIEGSVENTDVGIIPTIWNLLRNAFIEALRKDIDDTIEFNSNNTD